MGGQEAMVNWKNRGCTSLDSEVSPEDYVQLPVSHYYLLLESKDPSAGTRR